MNREAEAHYKKLFPEEKKFCARCKRAKFLSAFPTHRLAHDFTGTRAMCKECLSENFKEALKRG